jgi:quinoprotein glucose dehydrogenase
VISPAPRYSPLDQINAGKPQDLAIALAWPSPDNDVVKANPQARPGGYEDTPLMVTACCIRRPHWGRFAAIDSRNGKTIWHYDPQTWRVGRPGNLGYTHRGVAYWTDGKIERDYQRHARRVPDLARREDRQPDPAFGVNGPRRRDDRRAARRAHAHLRDQFRAGDRPQCDRPRRQHS